MFTKIKIKTKQKKENHEVRWIEAVYCEERVDMCFCYKVGHGVFINYSKERGLSERKRNRERQS